MIAKTLDNQTLIENFLEDCELRGMTSESIRTYRSALKIFASFINGPLPQVTRDDLRAFLKYLREERRNSQKRIKYYFSALSSFYDYLVYENIVESNIVLPIRKRYVRSYKSEDPPAVRKLISVEEMSMLINSTLSIRDKAIIALLAKTGVRRGELISIDLDDIDWQEQSITLKPKAKRSNRVVFFDDECARVLKRWIALRNKMNTKNRALFINRTGNRIDRNAIYEIVAKNAERVGLHNPSSDRIEDHFSPHCCRHWFTTWLLRNGMPREYVKELRGDARSEAIDIYHHIDMEDLRKTYLACIPQLGIE